MEPLFYESKQDFLEATSNYGEREMNNTIYPKENAVKKIETIMQTSPVKKESEDAYIINDELGIYGVLDGSTPMVDFKDENGHNGAYLAANLFKTYFESLQIVNFLHKEVAHANRLLKREMEAYNVDLSKKHHLWCTCVSVVQVKDDVLSYASLGDTMIVACDRRGRVNVLTVDTVKNISYRAKIKREIDRLKGLDVPPEDYFKHQQNDVMYTRSLANRPNGYSVANGMEEAEVYIQYGMLETKNLEHLLIMSDGLFDPKGNLNAVYREIVEDGLKTYVRKRTAQEQKQGKYSDDKTALLLYL
jgi:serine/threonine protein phosphatase PrpC